MISRVEIINNPYIRKMRILINGEAPSAFGPLDKFFNEPFLYWCDRIFPELEKELNGGCFTLHFESRIEEIRILEKISQQYPICTQFSYREILRNTPLIDRMAFLNQLLKNQIPESYAIVKKVLFIVPDGEQKIFEEIKELKIENCYCRIENSVIEISDFLQKKTNADIYFLICRPQNADLYLQKKIIQNGFMLLMAGQFHGFLKADQGIAVYNTNNGQLLNTIFECFILGPLADIFFECLHSLPTRIDSRYREKIEVLKSVSQRILIRPKNKTIECGTSIPVKFESDLRGCKVEIRDLEFGYGERGIIRCNGLRIDGIKTGSSILYVYQKGEKDPCAQMKFEVIKRNRVTELQMEDQEIVIGEGDRTTLEWRYSPPNADNVSCIEWSSDDSSIVEVDQNAHIHAVNAGATFVRISCGQVSTKTRVLVLPHIQDIELDQEEIILYPSLTLEISAKTVPAVTIEGKLKMGVMDVRVANAVNGQITGFAFGDTFLIIQDREEQIQKKIPIHVVSEKKYRKLNGTKKGIFASLFGK